MFEIQNFRLDGTCAREISKIGLFIQYGTMLLYILRGSTARSAPLKLTTGSSIMCVCSFSDYALSISTLDFVDDIVEPVWPKNIFALSWHHGVVVAAC